MPANCKEQMELTSTKGLTVTSDCWCQKNGTNLADIYLLQYKYLSACPEECATCLEVVIFIDAIH